MFGVLWRLCCVCP